MKTEITPELKERFFCLYVGVAQYQSGYIDSPNAINVPSILTSKRVHMAFNDASVDRAFLLLRELSSITDNEAIEVAKMVWLHHLLRKPNQGRYYVSLDPNSFSLKVSDYLRSIGIAIPYMGISVAEMISAGWLKLIDCSTETQKK